jgi:hypothetical protein
MSKHFARLAAVAMAGTMLAVSPGFAAPPMGGDNGPGGSNGPAKCTDPADPSCLTTGRHRHHNGQQGGQTNQGGQQNGQMNSPSNNGPSDRNGRTYTNNDNGNNNNNTYRNNNNSNNNYNDNNDHNNNDHNYSRNDHNGPPRGHPSFHVWMHGYHFPYFARPFFDVRPGIVVPHSYRLRRVPPEILIYYPEYAGFLYFIWRGEIVIVSPRSLRIVAILD